VLCFCFGLRQRERSSWSGRISRGLAREGLYKRSAGGRVVAAGGRVVAAGGLAAAPAENARRRDKANATARRSSQPRAAVAVISRVRTAASRAAGASGPSGADKKHADAGWLVRRRQDRDHIGKKALGAPAGVPCAGSRADESDARSRGSPTRRPASAALRFALVVRHRSRVSFFFTRT